MDNATFLDELEQFLRDSNPNLGRKSDKREAFILTVLKKVEDFICENKKEAPQDTKSKLKNKQVDALKDKVLCMEPNEQIRKAHKEGCAMMTEETSMQADEELGNPHNMTEEK